MRRRVNWERACRLSSPIRYSRHRLIDLHQSQPGRRFKENLNATQIVLQILEAIPRDSIADQVFKYNVRIYIANDTELFLYLTGVVNVMSYRGFMWLYFKEEAIMLFYYVRFYPKSYVNAETNKFNVAVTKTLKINKITLIPVIPEGVESEISRLPFAAITYWEYFFTIGGKCSRYSMGRSSGLGYIKAM